MQTCNVVSQSQWGSTGIFTPALRSLDSVEEGHCESRLTGAYLFLRMPKLRVTDYTLVAGTARTLETDRENTDYLFALRLCFSNVHSPPTAALCDGKEW